MTMTKAEKQRLDDLERRHAELVERVDALAQGTVGLADVVKGLLLVTHNEHRGPLPEDVPQNVRLGEDTPGGRGR